MGSMNAVLIWLAKSKGERVSAFKTLSFESKLTDPDAGDTPAIFFYRKRTLSPDIKAF
jgi:hypothetical protein